MQTWRERASEESRHPDRTLQAAMYEICARELEQAIEPPGNTLARFVAEQVGIDDPPPTPRERPPMEGRS